VGARFFTLIQIGPGNHPASYTNDTRPVQVVQQPGCGVDHPSPSSTKVEERVELYIFCASGPLWTV